MISQKAKLHNRFDFEIYDTETGETQYAQAENIVLNNMWARLCAGTTYFGYIGVGTGSGTLAPTRTTLFSHLAYKSAVAVEAVYDTDTTAHATKSVTFSETEALGAWTEVGILYGTTVASNYVTHALITDSEGSPITINKTSTRIITVYATVFGELLPPASGQFDGGIKRFNSILNALIDASSISAPFFWVTTLLKPDGSPAWLGVVDYVSDSWYTDTANKRRYSRLTRFGADKGNAPIRGILCGSNFNNHVGGVSVPNLLFPKKDFVSIALGSGDGANEEFDFPLSFIQNESETIYVNGVPKTRNVDYTVRYGMRSTDTMLVDVPEVEREIIERYTTFEEIAVLPQPVGDEVDITSIVMKNGGRTSSRMLSYGIQLSMDGENWVDAGSSASWNTNSVATLNAFAPAKYKYIKATFEPDTGMGSLKYVRVYATPPATKHIKFTTPPANGAVITADFSVEYIPKSENFVLDVQAEVLFGEG